MIKKINPKKNLETLDVGDEITFKLTDVNLSGVRKAAERLYPMKFAVKENLGKINVIRVQ